jgi:hypothetical protein
MRKTKMGIELPEGNDEAGTVEDAVRTLWKICCQLADALDELHEEINKPRK